MQKMHHAAPRLLRLPDLPRSGVTIWRARLVRAHHDTCSAAAPLWCPSFEQMFKQAKEAAEELDGWLDQVEDAPVYSPTAKEWQDPLAYIRSECRAAFFAEAFLLLPPVALPGLPLPPQEQQQALLMPRCRG